MDLLERTLAKPGSGGAPYPALATITREFIESSARLDNLVLGDSVMERIAKEDADRRTLGQMIADHLKGQRTAVISASANNPEVYCWLMTVLAHLKRGPRRVIIPINLRAFSPQWHMNPDWRMQQEITLCLNYILKKRDLPPIADVYRDDAAHAALASTPLDFPLSRRRTMGEFRALAGEPKSAERSREIFVFHYTHRLLRHHPKLTSLVGAAEFAREVADHVTLYVTPINVEAADRFVGPVFREAVRANVETLKAESPVGVIDLHDALPESAFFKDDTATEHLNETGRKALVTMILRGFGRS